MIFAAHFDLIVTPLPSSATRSTRSSSPFPVKWNPPLFASVDDVHHLPTFSPSFLLRPCPDADPQLRGRDGRPPE